MVGALWQLIPVALGVMASPVAVMALVGILLSRHARRNGVAYLMGWFASATVLLLIGILAFTAADAPGEFHEASWVPFVHISIAAVCLVGALWTFLRARLVVARVAAARTPDELAAATPQLPGLVRSVAGFTPGRSFLLGLGIFLTPMNIALVAGAAIAIVLATLPTLEVLLTAYGFLIAATAPVAIPVLFVLVRGDRADPMLRLLRQWMLRGSGFLTAGVLAAVGVLQIVRALQGWFA